MSTDFRSSVFSLCKTLLKDSKVEHIRNTIHNMHTTHQTDDDTHISQSDHGDLAYIASNQHAQFLGYLFIDESVEDINKQPPFHATHLSKDERFYLEEAHETILFFIHSCMEELKSKYPKSSLLIDPYSQYRGYNKKSSANSILQDADIKECVIQFKTGKVYQKLISNDALLVLENVDQGVIRQLSSIQRKQFTEDLDVVTKETEDYLTGLYTNRTPKPADVLLAYCSYCYALRSSLQIASQLIFDAMIGTKMIVMNNDNIIDLVDHKRDIIYEKYKVLLNELIIGSGNGAGSVALLVCDTPTGAHIKEFGIITSLTLSLVTEFGSSSKVTMITVDEELNRIHSYTNAIMNTELGKMSVKYDKTDYANQ